MSRFLTPALLAAAALISLAACSSRTPPASAQEARCQDQADKDPAVHALLLNAAAGSIDPVWQAQLARARHAAVTACLSAVGITERGGVEPVGTAHYGMGWY